MMEYKTYLYPAGHAEVSMFVGEKAGNEYHVMVHAARPTMTYQEQLEAVLDVYARLLQEHLQGAVAVFKRFFLSDAANQTELLLATTAEESDCAMSVVEQSPLDGTKVALWVYLQTDVQTRFLSNGLYEVRRKDCRQLWMAGAFNRAINSEYQMRLLLNDYAMQLMEQGCSLASHCVRTWIYVQSVDTNYAGVVKARNEVFMTQNLTEKTHYIASTGIGGRHADSKVLVMLDAFAVEGLPAQNIRYLYARTHLNPTYEYGVSFERGTLIDYEDRRQVLISGTASINNRGEILHPGDIRLQTERMLENVEALLQEAGCGWQDVQHQLVYLRDMADYAVVKEILEQRLPGLPRVITWAPVCRPGWLVEMECMAMKKL